MGISKSTTTDLQQGEENYFVVQANAKRDVHSADVSVGIEQVLQSPKYCSTNVFTRTQAVSSLLQFYGHLFRVV